MSLWRHQLIPQINKIERNFSTNECPRSRHFSPNDPYFFTQKPSSLSCITNTVSEQIRWCSNIQQQNDLWLVINVPQFTSSRAVDPPTVATTKQQTPPSPDLAAAEQQNRWQYPHHKQEYNRWKNKNKNKALNQAGYLGTWSQLGLPHMVSFST